MYDRIPFTKISAPIARNGKAPQGARIGVNGRTHSSPGDTCKTRPAVPPAAKIFSRPGRAVVFRYQARADHGAETAGDRGRAGSPSDGHRDVDARRHPIAACMRWRFMLGHASRRAPTAHCTISVKTTMTRKM